LKYSQTGINTIFASCFRDSLSKHTSVSSSLFINRKNCLLILFHWQFNISWVKLLTLYGITIVGFVIKKKHFRGRIISIIGPVGISYHQLPFMKEEFITWLALWEEVCSSQDGDESFWYLLTHITGQKENLKGEERNGFKPVTASWIHLPCSRLGRLMCVRKRKPSFPETQNSLTE
jgi:hypothetical protein